MTVTKSMPQKKVSCVWLKGYTFKMVFDIGPFVIKAAFAKSGTWGKNDPADYEVNLISIRIIGKNGERAISFIFLPFMLIVGYVA